MQNQRIKISNFEGKELNVIKYHEGFLGQRIGPVSSIAFHPYERMCVCGVLRVGAELMEAMERRR